MIAYNFGRVHLAWTLALTAASNEKTCGLYPQVLGGALGGTRTPNLLIRSQMLYPLSYERLRFA